MNNIERIDQIIGELYAMVERPGNRPLTSNEMRLRERSRRQMASQIKLNGGRVKPEYE